MIEMEQEGIMWAFQFVNFIVNEMTGKQPAKDGLEKYSFFVHLLSVRRIPCHRFLKRVFPKFVALRSHYNTYQAKANNDLLLFLLNHVFRGIFQSLIFVIRSLEILIYVARQLSLLRAPWKHFRLSPIIMIMLVNRGASCLGAIK